MSKSIQQITGTVVSLAIDDIDTDQIIPARFLKKTERDGWGQYLFRDWRYEDGDERKPVRSFVLNQPGAQGRILLGGNNFGCGSSREHAVWAIKDYGFDAVISSCFADIFRNNALNNFLLPVQVSEDFYYSLLRTVTVHPQTIVAIDVAAQTVTNTATGEQETFPVNAYKKACLLNGYDDVSFLTSMHAEITAFETLSR